MDAGPNVIITIGGGFEMGDIRWNKVLSAIRRRDVEGLRNLAQQTPHQERRTLFLLFADIVDSGLPLVESGRAAVRVVGKLVYDSFQDPLPAGVRAHHRVGRQVLYEAGPYCVDLRLERDSTPGRMSMAGQIAHRGQPGSMGTVPVLLMSGKSVLARTRSNQFGEFEMEYERAPRLRLYVPGEPKRKAIEVRLSNLKV
jgi:hypothetical protein